MVDHNFNVSADFENLNSLVLNQILQLNLHSFNYYSFLKQESVIEFSHIQIEYQLLNTRAKKAILMHIAFPVPYILLSQNVRYPGLYIRPMKSHRN